MRQFCTMLENPGLCKYLQTSEQQLGGQLDTKMKIPGKDEWSNYLAYIYHRYEKASVPDLSAYEDLHSDSE